MSTVQRRRAHAPEDGYDFGNKRQYRRTIWNGFAQLGTDGHALLMPALEGDEIDEALRHGFREDHLHVVDHNPAVVATLKRRYPRIHTYGVDVVRACRRIAKKGIDLVAANFDFCGPVSPALFQRVQRVAAMHCWAPRSRLAVTVLRGREHGTARTWLRRRLFLQTGHNFWRGSEVRALAYGRPSIADRARIGAVGEALMDWGFAYDPMKMTVWLSRIGTYRSIAGNQTMLWMMFENVREGDGLGGPDEEVR